MCAPKITFFSAVLALCLGLLSSSCGVGAKPDAKIFQSGEKAFVDRVSFSVVDSQTLPKLEEGGEDRIPTNRFYIVQISVFNGGNADYTVPTLALVDDAGQSIPELADGKGVQRWVGVSRKVSPGETLQGNIAFDAPVKHYKLLISGEFVDAAVYVDMPVSFVHERNEFTTPEPKKPADIAIQPTIKK